ncbi:MAG: VWA domain-containing protein [Caldilineaceae bacterium]
MRIDRLAATGGTDINRALMEALAQLQQGSDTQSSASRPAYILLTDGLPTQGERDSARILRNALNNQPPAQTIRLFGFGVGYDVNTNLPMR